MGDTSNRSVTLDYLPLPASVQEIAEVIGRDRALFLVGQLPKSSGKLRDSRKSLYVPKRVDPDGHLVNILGANDAGRMVETFGGERLLLSSCMFIQRQFRDMEVRRLHAEGWTVDDLAGAVGLTVRQIRNLVSEKARQDHGEAANDHCAHPLSDEAQ